MGVRLLWSYVRATVGRTIRLRAETPSQPLVVDCLSGVRRYFDYNYVWDFTRLRQRVRRDVDALRGAGFELIVFADPGYDPQKATRWTERRIRDLKSLLELNSALTSGDQQRIWFSAARWRPPLCSTGYITQAFHDAGCPVYIAKESADHEGAGLCVKHDAYGVLTGDTDFLMYPGIKRFLNYQTMRIENDGQVLVDGIEKSLFLRYLGISEEKLPLIVGFLGSDYFQGLTPPDKKYLEYKWKMEWLPEAAAMEINTVSTSLLPEDSHQAMAYYKPADPQRPLPSQSHPYESPYWITLREQQVFCRGVAMDSLTKRPCHEVLQPLRHAVYARIGMQRVTEYLCNPHQSPKEWMTGSVVEIVDDDPKAPEPTEDVMHGISLACDYLKATGDLTDTQHTALLMQVQQRFKGMTQDFHKGEMCREVFLSSAKTFPSVPKIDDLHVSSLFLQTIDVLYLGASCRQPPCWEIFHGPLFHFLCQNPEEMKSMPCTERPVSFDWTPILKPRLLNAHTG